MSSSRYITLEPFEETLGLTNGEDIFSNK